MFKKILFPKAYSAPINFILLLIRLLAGGAMLTHGWPKFQKLLADDPIAFADPFGIGPTASLGMAVFAEFFCAILVLAGFLTRLASIPLLITMLVALFIIHWDDPFAKQELSLIYGVLYMTLILAGAGKYSLDAQIFKKQSYEY